MVEHRNIIDAERHEVKGASSATAGQVLSSIGGGNTLFVAPASLNNIGMGVALEASQLATQSPSAVDTPLTILFGSGVVTTDVTVSAAGLITFNTAGLYVITFNLNFGRANSTGVSIMFARLLFSGTPSGFVQNARIDTSTDITPFNATLVRSMAAGSTISMQLIRDSAGANDGGLYSLDPVLAGWANSPSAAVRIQKFIGGA